jgi:hypothetical protein
VIHGSGKIARIKDVFNNPSWIETATSLRISIGGIAGDATNGLVVYRDAMQSDNEQYDNKRVPTVYQFAGEMYGSPTSPPELPIAIEAIMGDTQNGYVALGENPARATAKRLRTNSIGSSHVTARRLAGPIDIRKGPRCIWTRNFLEAYDEPFLACASHWSRLMRPIRASPSGTSDCSPTRPP